MEAIDETHGKIHGLKPAISRVTTSPNEDNKVGGGEIDAFT